MLKAAPEISTAMQAYTLRGWEGGEEAAAGDVLSGGAEGGGGEKPSEG